MDRALQGVTVRIAGPGDERYAGDAARLIEQAAEEADIARRDERMLAEKIRTGRAVLALDSEDRLVGFGYFSEWEGGRFVSHSGLVVDPAYRGRGLGKRIKLELLEASRRLFPDATIMSLTSSPAVERMNRSLGFVRVPLDELTKDPAFWEGCKTCRNYEAVRARGEKCCCFGMVLRPERPADGHTSDAKR